ncbi:ACP S-malonyltransferase [Sulfidibacter corallicola]|uniref:Malonyl CoA-acyl carrier protein transacylase n=1 Tax=Sulfidibacter corallicola TaxID=2818388 RepID=A0A8A4TSZ5_SULCO|nr:ACP S-malonyltransferase [Sulfidibacter corallicola]QTD52507.1 ACP S-malonyltransferase [Sulfidibacter corallicola]
MNADSMFLFPGQGSQVVGMARDLHDRFASVRDLFTCASDIAGFDVAATCFEGPMETLTETRNLQPALTAVVLACYRAAVETRAAEPAFVAGHSLGEYAALAAAGVLTVEDCLKLTTARGRLMQAQAEANPGAMGAVLKLAPEIVAQIVEELAEEHLICLANFNTPEQLVVSGSEAAIEALTEKVSEVRGRVRKLKVSGAWHSPLMKGAETPFNDVIDTVTFADARIPVLMNVTGTPEQDGSAIKENMKRQMCSGVRWCPALQYAWDEGVRRFVEFGPKGVLAKMMKAIAADPGQMETLVVDNPEKLENWSAWELTTPAV